MASPKRRQTVRPRNGPKLPSSQLNTPIAMRFVNILLIDQATVTDAPPLASRVAD